MQEFLKQLLRDFVVNFPVVLRCTLFVLSFAILALRTLEKAGISTQGLSSKSWDVFAAPDAPQMDLVITVCDNAAGEVCPYWPGQPATAHWGYADPSETQGSEAEKLAAFAQTLHQIKRRLEIFTSLPNASLERMSLQQSARALAQP